MVHGRVIRPAVAGAVPVKVDESSIKDIPGVQGRAGRRISSAVVAEKEWDAIKAAEKLKVEWSNAAPPFPRQAEHLRPHPQGAGAQARRRQAGRQCRRGVPRRRARGRGRIRVAVPVACQHGTGLRAGRDQGRRRRPAGPARRSRTSCATASPTCSACRPTRCARSGCRAPAPTAATMRATPRWTPPCSPRPPARRCALQYMRDQGTGWDPKGPASIHRARAAIDAAGNVIAYDFLSKGFSRIDVLMQREQAGGHARRPSARRAADGERRLRRPGRSLRVRQQARGVGDDRAAARARLAAALGASARSGRAADPFRLRVLHGRGGACGRRRSGRVPAAGTSRRRATSR